MHDCKFANPIIPEDVKHYIKERSQIDSGASALFNKLEQICSYIRSESILNDMVYPVIHSAFLNFIDANAEALAYLTTPDTPFINVHFAEQQWRKQAEQNSMK